MCVRATAVRSKIKKEKFSDKHARSSAEILTLHHVLFIITTRRESILNNVVCTVVYLMHQTYQQLRYL